jgi:hypothetical protein
MKIVRNSSFTFLEVILFNASGFSLLIIYSEIVSSAIA